jgi:hypothetical protein
VQFATETSRRRLLRPLQDNGHKAVHQSAPGARGETCATGSIDSAATPEGALCLLAQTDKGREPIQRQRGNDAEGHKERPQDEGDIDIGLREHAGHHRADQLAQATKKVERPECPHSASLAANDMRLPTGPKT